MQKGLVDRIARAAPEALSWASLADGEDDVSPDALRRHLAVLVARGLVDPRLDVPAPKPD